ncbi:MAG: hypothetical protein ABL957_12390 [Parvularculaceae bacterium]
MADKRKAGSSAQSAEIHEFVDDLESILEGEPRGMSVAELMYDRQLQRLGMQLWGEIQSRGAGQQSFEDALGKESLTPAELWSAGGADASASTTGEIARYKAKLRLRTDILTVLLEETIEELEKAERWVGCDAGAAPPENA